jgi:exodeoxyribonuclease-3
MKLCSWNVNGLRAVHKKGFLNWFEAQNADVICLQETKIQPDQVPEELLHPAGYAAHWHSAEKKGYSSLVTYSKQEPVSVRYGLGIKEFDCEGRVLITEFPRVTMINAYFPNSQPNREPTSPCAETSTWHTKPSTWPIPKPMKKTQGTYPKNAPGWTNF